MRASAYGSRSRAAISGPAEASGTPSNRCMTSSRRVHRSRCATGITTSRAVVPTAAMFAASTRKSSSSRSASAKPSASSRTPIVRPQDVVVASVPANRSTMSRSRSTTGPMPARWTLSTTCSPEASVAACTWATLAAASGSGETVANTSSTGRPSSATRVASTSAHGAGAARSCSRPSSATNSAGSRSRRVDSTWPSLTKVTPPSSSAAVSDRASCCRRAGSAPARQRPRSARPRPCRTAIRTIWPYRRVRAARALVSRHHSYGGGTEPAGTSTSASTRNTIAASRAIVTASTSRPNSPAPPVSASLAPCIAENSGPDRTNAMTPASSVRTIPNRSPSSRRATPASASTVSAVTTATST